MAEFNFQPDPSGNPEGWDGVRLPFRQDAAALIDEFRRLAAGKGRWDNYQVIAESLDAAGIMSAADKLADELANWPDPLPYLCQDVLRHLGEQVIARSHELPGREDEAAELAEMFYLRSERGAALCCDNVRLAYALLKRGDLKMERYDLDEASRLYSRGLGLLKSEQDSYLPTIIGYEAQHAQCHYRMNDAEAAERCCRRVESHMDGPAASDEISLRAFVAVAEVRRQFGDTYRAQRTLSRAVDLMSSGSSMADPNLLPRACIDLGAIHQSMAEYREAEHFYRRAYDLRNVRTLREAGDGLYIEARDGLSEVLKAQGRFDEAWDIEGEAEF